MLYSVGQNRLLEEANQAALLIKKEYEEEAINTLVASIDKPKKDQGDIDVAVEKYKQTLQDASFLSDWSPVYKTKFVAPYDGEIKLYFSVSTSCGCGGRYCGTYTAGQADKTVTLKVYDDKGVYFDNYYNAVPFVQTWPTYVAFPSSSCGSCWGSDGYYGEANYMTYTDVQFFPFRKGMTIEVSDIDAFQVRYYTKRNYDKRK